MTNFGAPCICNTATLHFHKYLYTVSHKEHGSLYMTVTRSSFIIIPL